MTKQQQSVLELLGESGWELVARDTVGDWRIDEVWRLRSVWTPRDLRAYLIFVVDPQAEIHVRKPGEQVWAVSATIRIPEELRLLEAESLFSFSHGWDSRLADLFAVLTKFRSNALVDYRGPYAT